MDIRPHLLVASTLAFLFSGFYKLQVPFPVDLTVVTCGLTIVAAALYWREIPGVVQPLTVLVAALTLWTAIRLFPEMTPIGISRVGENVVFGIPAFVAGHLISRHCPRIASWWLVAIGVPMAIYLAVTVAEAHGLHGIGSYQLTGLFLAFAMVGAATVGQPLAAAVIFLGIALTGHLVSLVAGPAAALMAFAFLRRWRQAAIAFGASAAIVLVYANLSESTPIGLARVLPKFYQVIAFQPERMEYKVSSEPATASAEMHASEAEAKLEAPPDLPPSLRPTWIAQYDRVELMHAAWTRFTERPFAGYGLGNANFVYDRYAHNVFLEVAAETGILGLALSIAIAGLSIWLAWTHPFAFGMLTIVGLNAMVSGTWGGRLFLFGIGTAALAKGMVTCPSQDLFRRRGA